MSSGGRSGCSISSHPMRLDRLAAAAAVLVDGVGGGSLEALLVFRKVTNAASRTLAASATHSAPRTRPPALRELSTMDVWSAYHCRPYARGYPIVSTAAPRMPPRLTARSASFAASRG
jgi:hypothetical protein